MTNSESPGVEVADDRALMIDHDGRFGQVELADVSPSYRVRELLG